MPHINALLNEATQRLAVISDSAALDAEVLLCLILGKERSYLRTWPDKDLQLEDTARFWTLIQQRLNGMPIAYITGSREFWSRTFNVTPDVLIPRPDTELLIEISLKLIPKDKPVKIIDLGTGSGIIAITLAAERPLAQVSATDLSKAALRVAKLNANKHETTHIQFYQSNWLANMRKEKFNIIVSNPPYIAENDSHLMQGDIRFEPQSALCADDQGLSDIKIIVETAINYLESGGYLLIEHGYDQEHQVQSIFKDFHYDNVQTVTDLSGQPRVTYGQWHYRIETHLSPFKP
ncbi:peptide chain release factor N(5)-glutamine methyltransferase [Methylobacter sp. S3L5C]|uniref:peptide chain release factor N(5)-glutamine methyltransferase n=1 Tax=Methylobacter sp. S3L5C TaxID=2839024 RepID=UPI001FAB89EA|nr:peptide chain release factor N(5)-glutamine methyltransferase [Methylobacter sp. S3L5C]UOA09341.1 peptide chain release factor N(5)-glutamine methyltransferase [Methylobacter sp. S3L5C]